MTSSHRITHIQGIISELEKEAQNPEFDLKITIPPQSLLAEIRRQLDVHHDMIDLLILIARLVESNGLPTGKLMTADQSNLISNLVIKMITHPTANAEQIVNEKIRAAKISLRTP